MMWVKTKLLFCSEASSTHQNHFFLRFLLSYKKENAHCKESFFWTLIIDIKVKFPPQK